MLTALGKFLRKLRIDQGEILKNMSDKLNVSVSFLSAVETGKKRMPPDWNNLICELYHLDKYQIEQFSQAIADTETSIEMNLELLPKETKGLAVSFAREFPSLNEQQIAEIRKILSEGNR